MSATGPVRRVRHFVDVPLTERATLALFGVPLEFRTNSPEMLALAKRIFAPFQADSSAPQANRFDLTVSTKYDEPAPVPEYRLQGHLMYMNAGIHNTIVADLEKGITIGFITTAFARQESVVRTTILECFALAMLGIPHHFAALHAAGLVKNGRGILLQGDSGLGKSSLAYAALNDGYKLLSEDAVHLKLGAAAENIRFWGLPHRIHLLPDAPRFFPELDAEEVPSIAQWKTENCCAAVSVFPRFVDLASRCDGCHALDEKWPAYVD